MTIQCLFCKACISNLIHTCSCCLSQSSFDGLSPLWQWSLEGPSTFLARIAFIDCCATPPNEKWYSHSSNSCKMPRISCGPPFDCKTNKNTPHACRQRFFSLNDYRTMTELSLNDYRMITELPLNDHRTMTELPSNYRRMITERLSDELLNYHWIITELSSNDHWIITKRSPNDFRMII